MTNFRLFQTEEFADDNFGFDVIGRKFYKWVENMWEKEKLLVMSNFSFSLRVFKKTWTVDTWKPELVSERVKMPNSS